MDAKLVSGAVRAYLAWERGQAKSDKLAKDIARMTERMTREEYHDYLERIR